MQYIPQCGMMAGAHGYPILFVFQKCGRVTRRTWIGDQALKAAASE
jgi:hypothetical protein